ncbi:hypothetical protein [Saccharothrix algeriensis]|uniref:Uncharacterized protein n=1 Tax=Saccharothrix algeriensis TaxID=173560 RepID=A0ABS2SES3_9PSEU|nr:hypothetical protein [Saccharothrix algeriensis]MBM7814749.1 hypothetical protein [Saccharothrix algeriensis]
MDDVVPPHDRARAADDVARVVGHHRAVAHHRAVVDARLRGAVGRLRPPPAEVVGHHSGRRDERGAAARARAGKAIRPALSLLFTRAGGDSAEAALDDALSLLAAFEPEPGAGEDLAAVARSMAGRVRQRARTAAGRAPGAAGPGVHPFAAKQTR